jgi:hypothetical protein
LLVALALVKTLVAVAVRAVLYIVQAVLFLVLVIQ